MSAHLMLQWLPGIVVVAAVSFPAFFYIHRSIAIRLPVALASVFTCLYLFGSLIGHEFHFLRIEDMPPLLLGLVLGGFLSEMTRAALAAISRKQAK